MGLSMMPVTTLGMATIPINLTSTVSAMSNVVRQVAASLGIAMFSTIMQTRQVFHYVNYAQSVNLKETDLLNMQNDLYHMSICQGWDSLTLGGVSGGLVFREISKLSIINAIDDCFIIATVFCLLAVIASFLIPGGKINPKSSYNKKTSTDKAA